MATATATHTAPTAPHALKLPRTAAKPTRPQPAVLTHEPARTPPGLDADGGVVGLLGGAGVLLIQLCALIPGLLPLLLLTIALALPLVLPLVALGIVVGVPVALWRLARRVLRAVTGRPVS